MSGKVKFLLLTPLYKNQGAKIIHMGGQADVSESE